MEYKNVRLSSTICINNLYTIHYFEYMNTFSFIGERHDFWEFCYADKGLSLIHISEPTRH